MLTIAGGIVLGGIALFLLALFLRFGLDALDALSAAILDWRLKRQERAREWERECNALRPR